MNINRMILFSSLSYPLLLLLLASLTLAVDDFYLSTYYLNNSDVYPSLILALFSSVASSITFILVKKGAKDFLFLKIHTWLNKYLILGTILFAVAMVTYLYALKYSDLSSIIIIVSTSYIWTILLAKFYLKEVINRKKGIGLLLIISGIIITYV